tara:strand:+ start:4563 stop:5471 length:909 start_codon:yes stop_codon:yes gene_type:complete
MSFLNPVNEPVLRFKSTDADAPQIDYNSRTAGDVKAVLKACLVDGYGTTASAGWSIVNEVDHVAEFISPSAAMSDYRLGIDDTSTSSTTWYYQYQNARVDIGASAVIKRSYTNIKKTSPQNGWQLLATERGLFFIEILDSSAVDGRVARITYFGQVKSALPSIGAKNIALWSIGMNAPTAYPWQFFDPTDTGRKHIVVADYSAIAFDATNLYAVGANKSSDSPSLIELTNEVFLRYSNVVVAQHPAFLLIDKNSAADTYKVFDTTIDGRPALSVCLSWDTPSAVNVSLNARYVLIYLDFWGY